MRRVDELAVKEYNIKIDQMMELAGFSLAILAKTILGRSIEKKKVALLIGKGNNGGGGLVAARHLDNWGVTVIPIIAHENGLKKSVKDRIETLKLLVKVHFFETESFVERILSKSILIIDCLIGYGIMGDPKFPISKIISLANSSENSILSLDLPSGLDPTTGKPYEPCVKAKNTLTLALPKSGLMFEDARKFVGNLFLADIGIPPSLYSKLGITIGNILKGKTLVRIF
jgi:NAD(P)H-hydrate epimerase